MQARRRFSAQSHLFAEYGSNVVFLFRSRDCFLPTQLRLDASDIIAGKAFVKFACPAWVCVCLCVHVFEFVCVSMEFRANI